MCFQKVSGGDRARFSYGIEYVFHRSDVAENLRCGDVIWLLSRLLESVCAQQPMVCRPAV